MAATQVRPMASSNIGPSQVARYIISLDAQRPEPDVTQLKLQKLLYLVQANYLASTGRRLFCAPVEAFDNGPVVYSVLKEYESCSRSVIAPDNASWDPASLPQDARAFIDSVWGRHRDCTASALWKLTHSQAPWTDAYEQGAFRKQIPDEAMARYFRDEVPFDQRILHPDVVVVDHGLLDDLDDEEDAIVARAINALR